MFNNHTSSEYKELYNYLLDKHKNALVKSNELESKTDHFDQCNKLMQMRVYSLIDMLAKVNEYSPQAEKKVNISELIKNENMDEKHKELLNLLLHVSTETNDIDVSLQLLQPVGNSLATDLPELSSCWSSESIAQLLNSIKINKNFSSDIHSYKDLKLKHDNYKTSEYVMMGLANQELDARKRRRTTVKPVVADIPDTTATIKEEEEQQQSEQATNL